VRPETLAVKAGGHPDAASGAVAPPITLSTTFERDPDGEFRRGYSYGRSHNPTRALCEARIAALESVGAAEGAQAIAFASGMAAAAAVLQSLAPGDRVVLPRDLYHGVRRLADGPMREWGLQAEFVEMVDPAELLRALERPARLVWIETPSNPRLDLVDLREACARAHAAGALACVDNTFAGPILQRPLQLGADLVVHSSTKYFGGHSDATGGAVVARAGLPLGERVRGQQQMVGAVPSPFDCWLIARGLQTLPVRVRAHCQGAQRVAEALAAMRGVTEVRYPGLPSHPQHALAARQMSGFGGVVTFRVAGGRDGAFRALARLRIIVRATSLGGVESTIEHRRSVEGPGSNSPDDLVRLAVGLEHPDDLIEDLTQALS
jgi:cystathionine gamma-synthase